MIPKVIHQIHLGSRTLTDQELIWQESWIKLHPEWSYILWTEEKISNDDLDSKGMIQHCNNFSEMSDVLRFNILYKYGGLYIDTDFECLKPIDSLLKDKDIVIYREDANKICGAFFAVKKNFYFTKLLLENLKSRININNSADKFGPRYIHDVFLSVNESSLVNNNSKNVYPFMWHEECPSYDLLRSDPDIFAVHHWNASWVNTS